MRNSMVIWLLQIPEKIRVTPLMETYFRFFVLFYLCAILYFQQLHGEHYGFDHYLWFLFIYLTI